MTSKVKIAAKWWVQDLNSGLSDFKAQLLTNHCTLLLFSDKYKERMGGKGWC